jgi:SAM-dependent methyltransferase
MLDVGAGTGAFTIPLARMASRIVAVEPSEYQLQILVDKARKEGLTNISTIQKYWKDTQEIQTVDYSLAAYSFFEEDIEGFLEKMIAVSRKGIFIVFRADVPDSLNEFAYGKRPSADYLCLCNILKDMGHQFDMILFPRDYYIPVELVFKQFRFSGRSPEELLGHLSIKGRLQEREDGIWASFSARDAMLYLIR